jgi:hypothetical protein
MTNKMNSELELSTSPILSGLPGTQSRIIVAIMSSIILLTLCMSLYFNFFSAESKTFNETYGNGEYAKKFESALISAKVGVIMALVLITVIYQVLYGSVTVANTYFSSPEYSIRALESSALTGAGAIISTIIVLASRGGFYNVLKNWYSILLIGFILSLYDMTTESSGFNRYMSLKDIEDGVGPYAHIDNTENLNDDQLLDLIEKENSGDPFITTVSYTSILLIICIVLYYIMIMIISTFYGYYDKNNSISKATIFGFQGTTLLFMLETFIVCICNIIPPLLSPYIRGDSYTSSTFITVLGTFLICIIFELMFQYNGFLIN